MAVLLVKMTTTTCTKTCTCDVGDASRAAHRTDCPKFRPRGKRARLVLMQRAAAAARAAKAAGG